MLTETIVKVEAEDNDEKVSVSSSTILTELAYIELSHLDILHFVIEECRRPWLYSQVWLHVNLLSIICPGTIVCGI